MQWVVTVEGMCQWVTTTLHSGTKLVSKRCTGSFIFILSIKLSSRWVPEIARDVRFRYFDSARV